MRVNFHLSLPITSGSLRNMAKKWPRQPTRCICFLELLNMATKANKGLKIDFRRIGHQDGCQEEIALSRDLHAPLIIYSSWPPSLNTLYPTVNGHRILSKQGSRFKKDLAYQFRRRYIGFGEPVRCDLFCLIELFPPDNRRRDIDNTTKIILDAFTDIIYEDDKQIKKLMVVKNLLEPPGSATIIIGRIDKFWEYMEKVKHIEQTAF
jgi:crossover junction endodeoxyribonuclease RusA